MAKSKSVNKKAKKVTELVNNIKGAKTLMVISIKGLPSRQYQDIKKSVRKDATIKVEKKNIYLRTIKEFNKESILKLEPHIKENSAFAISNIEGFELASIFSEKKTPVFAKAGQIAPMDIEVKEGPTDLVPGPAISELGALGIQISIENGKISIKNPKVVVKQGLSITENAASVLQKLNVQPFSVGLEPVAFYDIIEEKVYADIKIDSKAATDELKLASAKALGFAQKMGYFCKETIGYFLAKANAEGNHINSKLNNQGGNI
ncbi:MAG: 50S ribosomal protein L10 [Candidatus Pacearchaeota archaeon]|jgi:ribosomal protein L10